MAVLGRKAILHLLIEGIIKIEPVTKSQIDSGSIDLTLSNSFRVFRNSGVVYQLREDFDWKANTKLVKLGRREHYLLKPRELILGVTVEKVSLPANICGWIEGRSRFARVGLAVHTMCSYVQPGIKNKQVLELFNLSQHTLALYPGTRVCQLVLEEVHGGEAYTGKFSRQDSP